MSVLVGIGKLGRDRLVYRQESAARVRWQRDVGVHIDVTGGRVALPPLGSPKTERDALQESVLDNDATPIPYFPGSENLLIAGLAARTDVNERELVNPIARGAEAYYTFRTGDSLSFRLPDGRVIQLRELEVRPRVPKPNVVVGSLWFDIATGQLVRAAYRLAIPAQLTVTVTSEDGDTVKTPFIGKLLKTMVQPMTGRAFGDRRRVRFLRRTVLVTAQPIDRRLGEGVTRARPREARDRVHVCERERGDGPHSDSRRHNRHDATVSRSTTARPRQRGASTVARFDEGNVRRGVESSSGFFEGRSEGRLDAAVRHVRHARRDALPVGGEDPDRDRVPCDLDKLMASSDLPGSIFDPGDDVFGSAEAQKLAADALGMAAQAPLSLGHLPAPRIQLGPSMTRYNRVEGFSTGALYDQQLGAGLSATAVGRFGFADKKPNFELSLARSDFSKTVRVNGYTRLVSANDWGSPLNFSSSLGALLFGRDEGFYYRATGGEVLWTAERGPRLEVRAFSEQQRNAPQSTTANLGATFIPNIESANVTSTGVSLRYLGSFGRTFAASARSPIFDWKVRAAIRRTAVRRSTSRCPRRSSGESMRRLPWLVGQPSDTCRRSADGSSAEPRRYVVRAPIPRRAVPRSG
jgi:hypothetical protein